MKLERIIWIIAIFLFAGFFVFREVKNNRSERSLQTMLEVANDTIRHNKNKEGEWEAERRSQNITVKELRRNGQELGFDNAALRRRVGNLNNLVAQLKGEVAAAGEGQVQLKPDTVIKYVDGEQQIFLGHTFDWTNDYLTLNGSLDDNFLLNFTYEYYTDFEITTFWKRPKAFKRKELIINMTLKDPNAKAVSLNNIVVKPAPPKFYETTWFKIGIGFLGGVIITNL